MTDDKDLEGFRSGVVAVVGRPNVGKSTLVNALVEKELTITSAHPHTTRRQIRSIDHGDNFQIIYVDTPGIHKPRNSFSEQLNDAAYDALSGVDVIVAVFDASGAIGTGDKYIAEQLVNRKNVFVVLNKGDTQKIELLAAKAHQVSELLPNAIHVFVVSAYTSKNVHLLRRAIIEQLDVGPPFFDETVDTDLTDNDLVAEFYREQLLRALRDELPQGLAVFAQESEDSSSGSGDLRRFDVRILVNKKSHKPIVIGAGGSMLEFAGSRARARIESIFGCQVVLSTKVVVDEEWQSRGDIAGARYF